MVKKFRLSPNARWISLSAALWICSSGRADINTTLAQAMTSQQLIAAGRQAFLNRCSGCHGENADGAGPAAIMLHPKPRNLVSGYFKLRSTPLGVLPTISDLLRVLDQGIPGSSMPSFSDVAPPEKLAIVTYIRSLRPEFRETRADQQSIVLPPPPKEMFASKAVLLDAAKRGRAIYKLNCISCHGEHGKGDGLAAADMVDSEDRPIRPANLSLPRLKSGSTARDAFKAISTGLDGAPMPAYADTLKEKERWELVAYIFYLRGMEANIYGERDRIND